MPLSKGEISQLTPALDSPDRSIAKQAETRLDTLLHPPRTSGAVRGDEIARRSEAHYGPMRGSDALLPLLAALEHGTQFARAYAATALAIIKDPRAIPPITRSLSDKDPEVRIAMLKGLWFFRDPATAKHVIPLLDDPVPQVACDAADTLGAIGSPEAVPALLEFYERGDQEARAAVIHALGSIQDPRALPLLREASQSDNRKIRSAARSALTWGEHLRSR